MRGISAEYAQFSLLVIQKIGEQSACLSSGFHQPPWLATQAKLHSYSWRRSLLSMRSLAY